MDNSDEKKSKLPIIEGYQIEGPLSRTKSTVSFKATAEANRAIVLITLSTGEAYRTSLKPFLDVSFSKITKTLKLVEHPNIIPILDAGYVQEMPFTVTPYYPTGSLKKFVGTARNWRDVLNVLLPVADALAYCHDHGIIHRDVKPQNIVINDQGDLCLTNFSLLEPTAANKLSVTMTGSGECFPAYIAPEVWHGKCSTAVDQYGFGVMLYELLTSSLPFDASNIVSLLVQQAAETVAPPSTKVTDVPKVVDELIVRILASDPAERFSSMRDLRNAMQEVLSNPISPKDDIQLVNPASKSQKSLDSNGSRVNSTLYNTVAHDMQKKGGAVNPTLETPKDRIKLSEKLPKKMPTFLVILIFLVFGAVILFTTLYLLGLLPAFIFSSFNNVISDWISSVSLNFFASIDGAVPTSTLIAL